MTTAESDLLLLQRFKESRDPEIFAEIVRRYTGAVFATCFRILRDPGSAEDAAQETFFRLMTRPQKVTASLGGWLHRAATRLALDMRRSDGSRRRREIAYGPPEPVEASDWADVAPKLDEALAALPEAHRELLVRHFLRGEPQQDLAVELSISPATLSRRMKAALETLRAELAERDLSVAPGLLMTTLASHGCAVAAPAALKLAMGKMALYCTVQHGARSAALAKVSLGSMLRGLPRTVYGARWAFAAAGFSMGVAVLFAMGGRHWVPSNHSWTPDVPVRVQAMDARAPR